MYSSHMARLTHKHTHKETNKTCMFCSFVCLFVCFYSVSGVCGSTTSIIRTTVSTDACRPTRWASTNKSCIFTVFILFSIPTLTSGKVVKAECMNVKSDIHYSAVIWYIISQFTSVRIKAAWTDRTASVKLKFQFKTQHDVLKPKKLQISTK